FLQRTDESEARKDPNGYELVYGASSVKHLSAAELETYLQRLEELKVLLANRDSKPEETVEWLVRCAEDPVTRREGAYELMMSAWREHWQKEEAKRRETESALSQPKPREEEPLFSALLTSEQKQRLTEALLKTEEFSDGDYDLIELVKDWDEPRLLPFLVSY